jgi:hypothetical protein
MTALVGLVSPAGAGCRGLDTLWRALELALPVRFEARAPGEFEGLDGAVVLDGAAPKLPLPTLLLTNGDGRSAGPGDVVFAHGPAVPIAFRGRCVREDATIGVVDRQEGDEVLATLGGAPVWLRRAEAVGEVYEAATRPAAPSPDTPLRELFREGRFLTLLPLLELARRACERRGWRRPSLRASFMFDDPNLHWTSYGYLRFVEVLRRARERGYHVASAMVPLDGWFAHPAAARLFRDNPRFLSLLIHGNDHVRHELARPTSTPAATSLAEQALRRIERFERRCGVPVSRVMAAPHGRCSELMLSGLRVAGFDAICIGGRIPWLEGDSNAIVRRFTPADLVDGFPVFGRAHFVDPRTDLIFRAYLGQPVVVYGHHTDLAGGLGVLDEAADEVERLGGADWLPLDRIATSNYETCRAGSRLHVRLFTRRARLALPEGVEELAIEVPGGGGDIADLARVNGRSAELAGGQARLQVASPGEVEVVVRPRSLGPTGSARRGARPWPILRRLTAEGRDRALPLVRRRHDVV